VAFGANGIQLWAWDTVKLDLRLINQAGFVLYSILRFMYGGMLLSEPTGPYKVGYSEQFHTTKGNFCTVFYPTSDSAKLTPVPHGYLEGPGRIPSIQKGVKTVEPDDPEPPALFLAAMFDISFAVGKNTPLHSDFKELPVLVFSHAMMESAKSHVMFCMEVASYGVVVVGVDHLDGSSGFSVNQKTGEHMNFDCQSEDKESRRK